MPTTFRAPFTTAGLVVAATVSWVATAAPGDDRARPAIDLSTLRSPILLQGSAEVGYRDPLPLWHQGQLHLFFTLGQPEADGRVYLYVAQSTTRDLVHWSPPVRLTRRDLTGNFVSPGSIVRHAGQWWMCLASYPMPGKEVFANETARCYFMKSADLEHWSEPELIRLKGNQTPVERMGRMIDPYILGDKDDRSKWWCFYKQKGVSLSWSRNLRDWTYAGRTDAGENVCVLIEDDRYLLFHSPRNGIGQLESKDLVHWKEAGPLITLGQADWPWARGRITAGFVMARKQLAGIDKYVMFFHGTGPEPEPIKFLTHGCLGIAWSDDLRQWHWPK